MLITYIMLPTTVLLSHYYIIEAGASVVYREKEADWVSVQVTLPEDLTHTVPPGCCIMDEGQTLGGRGRNGERGPYYLVIHF